MLEKKHGLGLSHGRRTIEAVAANQYEAQLLGIEEGAPLVLLDSVSYLKDGRPIEYFHAVHRGDRSRFEVEVVRVRGGEDPLGHMADAGATRVAAATSIEHKVVHGNKFFREAAPIFRSCGWPMFAPL